MSSSSTEPASDYCPSFNHPDADIILRSSSNTHFKSFKTILSLSSPIFADMFLVSQPPTPSTFDDPDSTKDGLPVVPLSGTHSSVKALLEFCHPCENPTLRSLEEVKTILELAQMYEIAFIIKSLEPQLLKFAEKDPMRVYAIACIYELKNVAIEAAKLTLRHPANEMFPGRHTTLASEFKLISAQSIFRLQTYREDCVAAMDIPSNHFRNLLYGWTKHCNSCAKKTNSGKSRFGSYWTTFNERAVVALRERPCGETVLSLQLLAPCLKMICEKCPEKTAKEMSLYAERLGGYVDEIIAKVEMSFPF